MRLFVGRVAKASSGWLFVVGVCLVGSACIPQPAYAVETQVSVDVAGSIAPDFELDGSTSIVSSMPIILTGKASNLVQVRVLVDGIYTATIPLTPADTSFTYSLYVSAGTHTVKFIGISAYTSENVEQVVTVDYIPPMTNNSSNSIHSGSSSSTNGIVIGGNTSEESNDTPPDSSHETSSLPPWVVRLLVPLDLVNPAHVDETPHTLGRFFLFAFGLPLLLFAQPILFVYRRIRYGALGRAKPLLPLFLRKDPLLWLRLFGLVLLIAAFFWL